MTFHETAVGGAFVLEPERLADERGFFPRTFCVEVLTERGLDMSIAQMSLSSNARRGTLRGMHFQQAPHEETKIVRCIRGSVYDVVIDLRPASRTFAGWAAAELSADNRRSMYVPQGCAHGFLTLEDDTELEYAISTAYVVDAATGVRWDDPAFGVEWPFHPEMISERDAAYPLFTPSSDRDTA